MLKGEIFNCKSDEVREATFVLAECTKQIVAGEKYGPEDIKELFTGDSSRQAEFIFWANANLLLCQGKNLMLITNPNDELVFPLYNTEDDD